MDLTQASYMYRLTFLKLGLTSAGFGGCVLDIFLKAKIAKSSLFSVIESF